MKIQISHATSQRIALTRDGDHFVTQLNPDGTTRDFVDYDSNLLAAAFVPMSNERRRSILRRIDAGNCTHAAPGTYISEKLYGPKDVYSCDAAKPEIRCVGDSRVSYGRVAWLDAITRKLVGDHDAFERLCIAPIRSEVFKLYGLRLFLYFVFLLFLSSYFSFFFSRFLFGKSSTQMACQTFLSSLSSCNCIALCAPICAESCAHYP